MKSKLSSVMQQLVSMIRDEKGLSVTEYAVAGGLVAAVAAASFTTLGTNVTAKITSIATAISG